MDAVQIQATGTGRDKGRERKDSPALAFRKSRFICSVSVAPVGKIIFSAVLKPTQLLP